MYNLLHVHSMFSLHDSPQFPEELILRAKELGIQNVTLTDHGTMLGLDDFMAAGKEHGINAIPGLEAYLSERAHLVLVAKDLDGYHSISRALKEANGNLVKVKKLTYPIMNDEILVRNFSGNSHVIATSACINGPIGRILLKRWKMQKKYEEKQRKLDSIRKYYDEWMEHHERYTRAVTEEKLLKEEIKGYKRYMTKSYIKKAASDSSAKEQYEMALRMTGKIQAELKTVQEIRRSSKKTVDKLKSKKEKYELLQEEIASAVFPSEQELYAEAVEKTEQLKNIFPNFYMELQYHGMEEEAYVMPILSKIADELHIPVIAANDAHMARKGDENARQILRFNYFSKHQEIFDADRELYVKSEEELAGALMEILPKEVVNRAIANTSILEQCHVTIPKEPHYPVCKSEKSFYELVDEGKQRMVRNGLWDEEHESRLQREVKVIEDMGYIDYHMVVQDYCRVIRTMSVIPRQELNNIPDFSELDEWIKQFKSGKVRSPGRGSAAGSLVCYLLGITNIDPIRYQLLFDRYLNPERVSLPDIDTDVKQCLRPYIIRYLKWKYGENAVSSIMTKNTYGASNALLMAGRDRASELYESSPDRDELKKTYLREHTRKLTALIPKEPNQTIAKNEEAFKRYANDTEKCIIWERAKLIEGRLSGTGLHAGGVVIADNGDINSYVPLAWNEENQVWATQCDMIQVEEKGMLKMDLLGLKTQDIISETLQLIEKHHGVCLDIDSVPFEREVFEDIFSKGYTNSVFQFESGGMKEMLRKFKPDSIEDIIILVAMYRPGPMQFIDDVIKVKSGQEEMSIGIPLLRPILGTTYGAIVYQEQVMQIFQSLAGYSLGQADLVRRAMSKKKEEKLKKERKAFIYGDEKRGIIGCEKNGIPVKDADALFDRMTDFAKYAFNKSHAAAYAVISYQTAYLKLHYPAEFYCAMFNNNDVDEYGPVFEDCRIDGIQLLPVDINRSYYDFVIENGNIRYGFKGIKGVGSRVYPDAVIKSRQYTSLTDFVLRTAEDKLSSKFVNLLCVSGAFDQFTKNRKEIENRYMAFTKVNGDMRAAAVQLFDTRFPAEDRLWNRNHEAEVLGTIVSDNPLAEYKEESVYSCVPYNMLTEGSQTIMGYVTAIEDKVSKKGNQMLIVSLMGKTQGITVLFMDREYNARFLNRVVRIKGHYKDETFFGDSIDYLPPKVTPYFLKLDTLEKTKAASEIMKSREEGSLPLLVEFHFNKRMEKIRPLIIPYSVTWDTITKLHARKFSDIGKRASK